MKILTYSTLYPNREQIRHGIFVEQRLRHLVQLKDIESRVVAPVPWFPFKSKRFGRYSDFSRVPVTESRHGIEIYHPRYFHLPKIGMSIAPLLLAAATLPLLKKLIATGYEFDLIDAHYFYPDGVAAAYLGKILNKPVVITARGSDINLFPQYALPRKMIIQAARQAKGIITVCDALREKIVTLGVNGDKVTTHRNGVDLKTFYPQNREKMRKKYGISNFTLLSVGNLVELKGHHLIVQAMGELPDCELLIAGKGEELQRLKCLAGRAGVSKRVHFLGELTHKQLVEVYSAVDVLVLASSREGWANVLLESLACGASVIATNVGGTPEVIKSPDVGILMKERSSSAIVKAILELQENRPSREKIRQYAENFSWDETVDSIYGLFQDVLVHNRTC